MVVPSFYPYPGVCYYTHKVIMTRGTVHRSPRFVKKFVFLVSQNAIS